MRALTDELSPLSLFLTQPPTCTTRAGTAKSALRPRYAFRHVSVSSLVGGRSLWGHLVWPRRVETERRTCRCCVQLRNSTSRAETNAPVPQLPVENMERAALWYPACLSVVYSTFSRVGRYRWRLLPAPLQKVAKPVCDPRPECSLHLIRASWSLASEHSHHSKACPAAPVV